MNIILNGQPTKIDKGEALNKLVEKLKLDGPVAAQVNEEIIPLDKRETLSLKEGDCVELFRMMGGG